MLFRSEPNSLNYLFNTSIAVGITSSTQVAYSFPEGCNPSAAELQDFADADGVKMYEKMAEVVAAIANEESRIGERGYSNVGMVVGATSPEETSALRVKYPKSWLLIPGYGSQGATAADCVRFCNSDGAGAIVNASRSIIYAYELDKYKVQFGAENWEKCIEQAVIDAKVELSQAMGV